MSDLRYLKRLFYWNIDLVLDIGASNGVFGLWLRRLGYRGPIIGFEPLPRQRLPGVDWPIHEFGIGDSNYTTTLNIAGGCGDSSSILPMLERHRQCAPYANYCSTKEIQIKTLDSIWDQLTYGVANRVLIKIDVQGYEGHILRGGRESIPKATMLQVETSLVPLYEGELLLNDWLIWAYGNNWQLVDLLPGFEDSNNGQLLQTDLVLCNSAL